MDPASLAVMLLAAVITRMITTHQEDMEYARHGQDSPRYKLKMAKLAADQKQGKTGGVAPSRPGTVGYVKELWADGMEAANHYREKKRQTRLAGWEQELAALKEWSKRSLNTRDDGKPVDDMLDVAGVREAEAKTAPPKPARITQTCPVCFHDMAIGADCQHCAFERQIDTEARQKLTEQEQRPKCNRCPYGRIIGTRQWPGDPTSTNTSDQHCDYCGWLSFHRTGVPTGATTKQTTEKPDTKATGPIPTAERPDNLLQLLTDRETTNSNPTDQPLATVIPMFPIMKEPTMNAEITGLPTAIAFAKGMASAHRAASTAGGEQYVAALRSFEVGDGIIATVGSAQELSAQAAAAWERVAAEMSKQTTVTEAYQAAPDAGNKRFVTGE